MSHAAGDRAPVRLRTRSADDTRAVGAALARGLRPGDVVLLEGDLGSGKTTLAQGVGAGLGVADPVTSPTFTLVRSYPCAPGPNNTSVDGSAPAIRTFLHADLYRLDRVGEVVDLAIGELVEDDAVAVVEWGGAAEPVLGHGAIFVHLGEGGLEDERCIAITVDEPDGTRRTEFVDLLAPWTAP